MDVVYVVLVSVEEGELPTISWDTSLLGVYADLPSAQAAVCAVAPDIAEWVPPEDTGAEYPTWATICPDGRQYEIVQRSVQGA